MWSLNNPRIQAAAICLLIALVYVFIWPGRKNPERTRQYPIWQRIVLRWFHSLTWVLIAVACVTWSKLPAAAAFVVYMVFLFATLRARNTPSP
jgi:hypothetical protein